MDRKKFLKQYETIRPLVKGMGSEVLKKLDYNISTSSYYNYLKGRGSDPEIYNLIYNASLQVIYDRLPKIPSHV